MVDNDVFPTEGAPLFRMGRWGEAIFTLFGQPPGPGLGPFRPPFEIKPVLPAVKRAIRMGGKIGFKDTGFGENAKLAKFKLR